ncbi:MULTISPECIES: PTS sugar transporter subunit IIA [Mesoplasma]|uniref:Ascorbate-specific PTS system EIIA component n=1 Tax=Mesoplasma florum TaxID=2151 RepID=A0A2R3P7B4_MESFO|nr:MULTISPECIES: PTS sugar transporter subunit IIA [Mesoplasma]AVN64372.1 PTS sugar transporter subunit IIA [Mesoplasma florum]
MKIFKKEFIQFADSVSDWKEALKLASKPLIENENVKSEFVEKLISETERLGPYYILAKDLALAHISPEESINKNGLSLLFLNNQVNFKNDSSGNVKFLFILAAVDGDSHLDILKDLSLAFGNKEFYEKFYNVKTFEDIIELTKILN